MTLTESTTEPALRHALRHIGNRGQVSPYCCCGHCLAGEGYSGTDLALDACVTQMLDMVGVIESRTSRAQASIRLSLRVLHDRIDEARKLLCAQRQTARALASIRYRAASR